MLRQNIPESFRADNVKEAPRRLLIKKAAGRASAGKRLCRIKKVPQALLCSVTAAQQRLRAEEPVLSTASRAEEYSAARNCFPLRKK